MDYGGYKEYPQKFPPFVHGVTILDLLFNMGLKFGRTSGDLVQTIDLASRLLRFPLWLGMEVHQEAVVREIGAGLAGT